jgi:hypothetical protein
MLEVRVLAPRREEEQVARTPQVEDRGRAKIEDGIDTFVFRDGLIRVQTVRYTLQRI